MSFRLQAVGAAEVKNEHYFEVIGVDIRLRGKLTLDVKDAFRYVEFRISSLKNLPEGRELFVFGLGMMRHEYDDSSTRSRDDDSRVSNVLFNTRIEVSKFFN
ncbi:hypothetical protein AJ79_04773 [Helicocarpus griseus UAMH5409]|uniref:Uncharacterized protein n=1 Tax=Helicocarpus griseus UAMH5409 TaxID=1447875 RepID=A0A2B7XS91_9EURO|nr:hypothetical protein AJ79_04773 [Helicocarpus griseus UAMH5409]